ncbi:MAG: CRISPR-associated endonuclease Cas1 [Ostreibacterium sp.]
MFPKAYTWRHLLPLRQLVVCCCFTADTILPCFHQTVFPAYLYTLLDCLSPEQAKTKCRFIFPESGRTAYRKGDSYHFSVVALGDEGYTLLTLLPKKLQSGIAATDARTLHQNLAVIELIDGFSGEIISDIAQLSQWTQTDLLDECQQLQKTTHFRLQSDTGILFKQGITKAGNLSTSRLLQQLLLSVVYASNLALPEKTQRATQIAEFVTDNEVSPTALITHHHLFFINKTYANKQGRHKHLSGYHGTIDLCLPDDFPYKNDYLPLLLMGQYLGIGKRTNYGIGQYQLIADKQNYKHQAMRSQSLLDDTLNIEKLIQHSEYATLSNGQKNAVLAVRDKVLQRRYQSGILQTYEHTEIQLNGKQKTRTLSVAPLPERIVQKMVAQTLSQALDSCQHSASYGYRPKRNRKQAVSHINRHIKYGRNWILESDIADCFDSIAHDVVITRLRCLLNDDDLIDFIVAVLSAPLSTDTENTPPRCLGIPQGCPLSPLIANLVLTDLDYDLSQQGFYHVRFADDFVVCCNNRETAEKALLACKKSLSEHKLTLKDEKTHIVQSADSFVFLGYQLNDKGVTDLSRLLHPDNSLEPKMIAQTGSPPINHRGQTLFVCYQKHSQLTLSSNHLVITGKDKIERTPLAHIRQILLLGGHHLTTPLVQYCLRNGIDIHYLSHTGQYLGALTGVSQTNQYKTELWLQQESFLTNEDNRLALSRIIIAARLHNMRKTLVNYQYKQTNTIDYKLHQILTAKDLHEVRGYEGLATRFYYLQLNQLLKNTNFHFELRTRRPPKDPFNVLLSLGYTILYNYLNSFLLTQQLNPDRGFLHYTQSNHIALCSDLIEPFRHWIERAALTVIRRKQIQLKHFYYHNQACCLTADGRKIYLSHLTQMLESSSKHGNLFKQRNIEKIYRQAAEFKRHLQQPMLIAFEPYRE